MMRAFLMYNIALYKAQVLAIRLRRESRLSWLSGHANDLTFFTMLGLPFIALGLIFQFAYQDHIRVAAEKKRIADITCLAQNVYFEARGESLDGQHAVAEVTLNRVASSRFPDDVCAVVHEQRWDAIRKRKVAAFSWTELDTLSKPKGVPWDRATMVAVAAYDQRDASMVPGALFYHADRISPRWSRNKKLVAEIGRHRFYE